MEKLTSLTERARRLYMRLSQILTDRLATAEDCEIHPETHAQAAVLEFLAAELRQRVKMFKLDEELIAMVAEVLREDIRH